MRLRSLTYPRDAWLCPGPKVGWQTLAKVARMSPSYVKDLRPSVQDTTYLNDSHVKYFGAFFTSISMGGFLTPLSFGGRKEEWGEGGRM